MRLLGLPNLLDIAFPPLCLRCKTRVGGQGMLCAACWQQLAFISEPFCVRCGIPFEYAPGGLDQCGKCLRAPPPFTQARAVLRYDDASKLLVLRLKYHDDAALAVTCAPWLQRVGEPLFAGADALIPVPLHYWRFVGRRYNQAALLANALAKHVSLPVWPHALKRIRATPPQAALRAKERAENIKGAFAVPPRETARLRGKTVLLIDDVYTTGATLSACTEALLEARVSEVRVLTLARRGSRTH